MRGYRNKIIFKSPHHKPENHQYCCGCHIPTYLGLNDAIAQRQTPRCKYAYIDKRTCYSDLMRIKIAHSQRSQHIRKNDKCDCNNQRDSGSSVWLCHNAYLRYLFMGRRFQAKNYYLLYVIFRRISTSTYLSPSTLHALHPEPLCDNGRRTDAPAA